jgi:hypothetical protein
MHLVEADFFHADGQTYHHDHDDDHHYRHHLLGDTYASIV